MALKQTFSSEPKSNLGTEILFKDTTGDYSVTNTGGYGSPNTERADLALIGIFHYKPISGDVDKTPVAYDPETVIQWELQSISLDGWYRGDIYSVPKSTGMETPSTNDFRYDFATDLLERYNGSSWVTASNADLETYGADYLVETEDYIHLARMEKAFIHINKLLAKGCECNDKDELRLKKADVHEKIIGVYSDFCATSGSGNKTTAQQTVEDFKKTVDEYLLLE